MELLLVYKQRLTINEERECRVGMASLNSVQFKV